MITKLKIFEKIINFNDDLGLGFELFEGMVGVLINHSEYSEMRHLIKFLQNDIHINFRLLITNRICLLLFEDDDARELPSLNNSYEVTNHYIPLDSGSRYLGWFFQDIIDEDNWEEVIIENDVDVNELEERMKMYSQSNKYNL